MWEYGVESNQSGVIISSTELPNKVEHWSVGWSIEELKKYYFRNEDRETDIDKTTHVFIDAVK